MSDYTTDQILDIIEELGDPSKLDLSQAKMGRTVDLSGIDLGEETIQEKYRSRGWPREGKEEPPWYSEVTQGIYLVKANLQGAVLPGANLQDARLDIANLQGAYLRGANLQGADLWRANLQDAVLSEANLQGAGLRGANLQGADLTGANLQGADLTGANLQEVDLEEAESLEGAFFEGARLHLTRLRSEQVKQVGEEKDRDYKTAQAVYLALKVNFKEIGYYGDARWAYLKERLMERKAFFPSKKGEGWVWERLRYLPLHQGKRLLRRCYEGWLYARLFFKPPSGIKIRPWEGLWSWVQDFFTEYMDNPLRIILRLIVPTPLIFELLYRWLDGITNILPSAPPVSPPDYLFFSLRTLVTLAYSDFVPVGWGQLLAPLEGAFGVFFLALFAFSVAKRISRD